MLNGELAVAAAEPNMMAARAIAPATVRILGIIYRSPPWLYGIGGPNQSA